MNMAVITPTPIEAWIVFAVMVVVILGTDLFYLNRKAHVPSMRESVVWAIITIGVVVPFTAGVYFWKGKEDALAFTTAYLLEKALSVDNLFIFLVIFSYFKVPDQYRHRVLFWGIMGAIVMRGLLIGAGVALITYFQWLLFVFGGILVLTGIKLAVSKEESYEPSKTLAFRLTRRYVPMTDKYHEQHFFAVEAGRHVATPLFLILVMIETTDLIFALDSIPACLAISQDPFIVYTSNIFAIMGLRALYFVLAGLMASLRFLRPALAAVLVFIGCKMLWEESRKHGYLPSHIAEKLHITTGISLTVVASIIGLAVVASLLWPAPKEKEAAASEPAAEPQPKE